MVAPDVGGGFGVKAPFYPEEAVIPAAAIMLGRPVKWAEDRRENFMTATQERDQYWTLAVALDDDGKILGLRGDALHDQGAFMPWGMVMPYIAGVARARALCGSELPDGPDRGGEQQGAGRAGARRRPAAGGVRHRAAAGSRGAARSASTAPSCAGATW